MNYQKHYSLLIEKAKSQNRKKSKKDLEDYIYYETHHIIPICRGGTNDKSNLILLTAEEHFLAHQLLAKIFPESTGLLFAAIRMTFSPNGQRINNKLYSWLRKAHSENNKKLHKKKTIGMHGKKHAEETKQKMRENNYFNNGGKQLKGEENPNFGLKRSQETRNKLSLAKLGLKLSPHTEETKQKMREKRKIQTKTSQKEIMMFDVKYSSLKEACNTLVRNHKYIIYRLRSDKFLDCYYL